MRNLENLFSGLAQSRFRARFKLGSEEQDYLAQRGLEAVLEHARNFIAKRLAPAMPRNDGKQTPMRGHPVFIAQHATATCCRKCLTRWHSISAGHELSAQQQAYIVEVIQRWLQSGLSKPATGKGAGSPESKGAVSPRE